MKIISKYKETISFSFVTAYFIVILVLNSVIGNKISDDLILTEAEAAVATTLYVVEDGALQKHSVSTPSAKIKNVLAYIDKPVPASRFVYDIVSESEVIISYKIFPDFTKLEPQTVYIVLADAYGNKTELTAILTVVIDDEPPVIEGVLDKEAALNGTVSYRSGVTVTDNYDPNPKLTIDSSGVNLKKPGTYPVVYTAEDENGNISQKIGSVYVSEIEASVIEGMADAILSQIIDDKMTEREKAWAIFRWVTIKMSYSAGNYPRHLILGAHACFSKGVGDCYVFMAGSRVLLMRAGIPTFEVKRINGYAEHYWLLVDTGDGWRHYDTCFNAKLTEKERFMFTESMAEEYTIRIGGGREFYRYDKSSAPKVVD